LSLFIWIHLIVASKSTVSKTSYLHTFTEYIFEENWFMAIKIQTLVLRVSATICLLAKAGGALIMF
jgi:hypothetical protein